MKKLNNSEHEPKLTRREERTGGYTGNAKRKGTKECRDDP